MNADKIYAETIAKEYVPKLFYKTVALKKLDRKAKKRATVFACTFGVTMVLMLDARICLSMQAIGGIISHVDCRNRDKAHRTCGHQCKLSAL
ncbi:hypothetical protein ACLUWF_02610 [Limosilactobacillus mucosae]|uniref:hypothetical protein n=1 Tax=Limosilactobacillus mucosae TaxID=97478 RepID=UPI0039961CFE